MIGQVDPAFWRGRRVLLTGHTGFKGAWCALWLSRMGAHVIGFALAPETDPSLYEGAQVAADVDSRIGDLRDRTEVRRVVDAAKPEIVLHMAAQAIVRRAFHDPVGTVSSNVLGTMHLLDALRDVPSLRVVLVITSDKVYHNADTGAPFREDDPLGGNEMYGASKAAAELVTRATAQAHFVGRGVAVATARGGNVIGGGDYAEDRLVPDLVRAAARDEPLALRHPDAVRPWQHVLDCLSGYLIYVQALAADLELPHALNVGPPPQPALSVRQVAESMLAALGATRGWRHDTCGNPYEAHTLVLDSTLLRTILGWSDSLPGSAAIEATAAWYRAIARGESMRTRTLADIDAFMKSS
jgi:CDP-glucose 4,6-dehydratase